MRPRVESKNVEDLIGEELVYNKQLSKTQVFDISNVEHIVVQGEGNYSGKDLTLVTEFIAKYPNFTYVYGYEGYETVFFSNRPKELKTYGANMFHRGGSCFAKSGDLKLFVCLDLD